MPQTALLSSSSTMTGRGLLCGVRALRDYLGKLQTKGVPLLPFQLLLVHAADVALHEAAPN
jgi:hypothetical protein